MENIRIMNAAGWCKTDEHVEKLARSGVDTITVGSITWDWRAGNASELQDYPFGFNEITQNSVNWLGLPGPGLEYYMEHLPTMVTVAHEVGKKLRVSVAGFNRTETVGLVRLCIESGADEVELNFGCPNTVEISDDGIRFTSDPISYLPGYMHHAHIMGLRRELGTEIKKIHLSAKLSPLYSAELREKVTSVINESKIISSVVICNTLPDVVLFDEQGEPYIRDNEGKGGLGGKSMLNITIGQILSLRPLLANHVSITGCGGIFTGKDLWQYTSRGISEVQIGTALIATEDMSVPSKILEEYSRLS